MALKTLSLVKAGDEGTKLHLNLKKGETFSVELFWESKHDLDAHALLATNNGDRAKVSGFEQVLSTYVFKRKVGGKIVGEFDRNSDGSFQTLCGSLRHSGDALTGKPDNVDEMITIDGSKIGESVNEIPIFVTIHPPGRVKFAEVAKAGIRIKNDQGVVLAEYQLSKQFGQSDAVQMGSLVLGANGWEFAEVGVGFNGDFNTILESFS